MKYFPFLEQAWMFSFPRRNKLSRAEMRVRRFHREGRSHRVVTEGSFVHNDHRCTINGISLRCHSPFYVDGLNEAIKVCRPTAWQPYESDDHILVDSKGNERYKITFT